MINTKKTILILLLILIPSISIATTIYLSKKGDEEVKGVMKEVEGCKPYITNVLPNIAFVGEEYLFIPNIVGCKMDEVEISINSVEWLYVRDRSYIYGIPSIKDIGTHKLEITVYGRAGTYTLSDYIIVKENEE